MKLKPFWLYYGGKYRAAPKYPKPLYDTIIEPFAGAAGYSTRYPEKKVILCDLDPVIAGLWQYLIKVSPEEVMSLPTVVNHVDDVKCCQEAKWLIGFWLNPASATPKKQGSTWYRKYANDGTCHVWGEKVKLRVAQQVPYIRHWQILNSTYIDIDNKIASWFIDPPYARSGKMYKYKNVDYCELSLWCQERQGQVIVCEQEGADWLPFQPFITIQTNPSKRGKLISKELIWYNHTDCNGNQVLPPADN